MQHEVLAFWFDEVSSSRWFTPDPALDAIVRERFGPLHARAVAGELPHWRRSAAGRLAEVIVLDQFSRNLHRGTAAAFAADGMALVLAQEAIAAGCDAQLPRAQRIFFYLPYMHSESAAIHALAVPLFESIGGQTLEFELRHKAIIDRFGRYPHRNAMLGRESTAAERAFLATPGSAF